MHDLSTSRFLYLNRNAVPAARWVWPIPRFDGDPPTVLGKRAALDVELGYAGRLFVPGGVPVFAAQDGVVTYAAMNGALGSVSIDHAGGWTTRYSALSSLLLRPTSRGARKRHARVRAGDVIGYAARRPLRVGFEVWRLDEAGQAAIDPRLLTRSWTVHPWSTAPDAGGDQRAA